MSDAPSASDPREVLERVRAIAERVVKARGGDWFAETILTNDEYRTPYYYVVNGPHTSQTQLSRFIATVDWPDDADFIAAAREDVPWLLPFAEQWAALPAEVIDRIRAGGGLAAYVRDLEGERARLEEIALHHQAEQKRLETANDRLTVQHAERGKVNADLNKRLQRAERQYTNSQRTVAEVTKAFEDAEGRLRDLAAALARAEGERDEARATVRAERDLHYATMVDREKAAARLAALEAALQRLAGHHHAVTHTGRYEACPTAICREAREALSPPGATRVAPAAEPSRADGHPSGA